MAVEMIGGPRLGEPLLATGLGRFTRAAYDKLARNYFSALCLVAVVAFWL
jgi:hypothetical protein